MSCEACADLLKDGAEPDCLEGECPVAFDALPEEALRAIQIRGLLVRLAPLGLADRICKEYDVDRIDLERIAYIENELEALKPEKPHGGSQTENQR